MKRTLLTLATACLAMMWLSCDSDSPTSTAPTTQILDLSQTPREDREAEVAAMVISHQLTAPQWLYERIRIDLEAIRDSFGDTLPVRSITFVPLSYPSIITARVDTLLLRDSATRGIQILDSLNRVYGLKDTSSLIIYSVWLDLRFNGVLNPCRLIDAYSRVPGFKWLFGNPHAGDNSEIYILAYGNKLLYFFREGWGDCLAGCIHSRYYYFQTTNIQRRDRLSYIGSYKPDRSHPELAPAWFDTTRIARDSTIYLCSWKSDST